IQTFKQVIAEEADLPAAMVSLIQAYQAQNQIDEAESYLSKLVTDNPNHPIANTFLAVVHLTKNQHEQAGIDLKKSIAVNPNWGYSHGLLGLLYWKHLNQIDKAISTYRDGMQADPKDLQLPINQALLYQQTGDIESAIKLYESTLEQHPSNLLIKNNLASILTDYRSDRKSLERARELADGFEDAEQPMLWDTLGWIYVKLGYFAKALPLLKKAADKIPDSAVLQYHLGIAYYKKGDSQNAKTHLGQAISIGPDFPGAGDAKAIHATL
ncbi:MAG: tetratricopeptide repeat protein, partial [Methylococcales bacterium]